MPIRLTRVPHRSSGLLSDSIYGRVLRILLETQAPLELPLPTGQLPSDLVRRGARVRGARKMYARNPFP